MAVPVCLSPHAPITYQHVVNNAPVLGNSGTISLLMRSILLLAVLDVTTMVAAIKPMLNSI